MVKTGNICGNTIKLFLSSRSEMQSVIAQARANPTKTLSTAVEQHYQQQDQNGANLPKVPSANAISSILAEFQAKAAQQQQLQIQQQTPVADPANNFLLAAAAAAAQNGSNPLAIQQLLAALNEKQQQQQQQQQPQQPFPFQMPLLTNPANQYSPQTNGWIGQQVRIANWNT